MKRFSSIQSKTIIIDTIIFIFCILGIYNIISKSALPFQIDTNLKIIQVNENFLSLEKGDSLILIDSAEVKTKEEIEIVLDGKNIGEEVLLSALRSNELVKEKVILSRFYSTLYTIIAVFLGLMFYAVALILLLKCDDIKLALVVHWSFIFTAMIIMMTWGNYTILPFKLGLITRLGFHVGYLFAPVLFLKFSILFPTNLKIKTRTTFYIMYSLAFLLMLALCIVFYAFSRSGSIELIRVYITIFDLSSLFIAILIISATSVFIHTYTTTSSESDRKKLRWIILGFFVGPLGYLFLWVIPSRIWNSPILPESVVLILVAFLPVTFAIAIIKYRLMNVDIIFKRSLVYTTVISLLLIVYITIISIAANFFNNPESESSISSIIAAISIALLFQPAKRKVQKFVDKKFFRIEYDYRIALNMFNKKIRNILTEKDLVEKVINLIIGLIPVDKLGYFSLDREKKQFKLIHHKNLDNFLNKKINLPTGDEISNISLPISTANKVESGVEIHANQPPDLKEIGSDLMFLIKSPQNEIYGLLILGEKKSGTKYTAEDIDLLNIITARVSLTLDRIELQNKVILEHMETERLEELNKLKSFFVSSISHDLKTPLTSIKLFAEQLRTSKNIDSKKQIKYLEIIEGESNRLTRLINNVLDYSKIERGTQTYTLKPIDLVETIRSVLISLEYQIQMGNFSVDREFEKESIMVIADADAVAEAVVNLFSNALKYSLKTKHIKVAVCQKDEYAVVEVSDSGEGISAGELENIFDPFFRSKNEKIGKTGGAGLGLAIVKHIMDSHGGKVEVESEEGVGSKFSLLFSQG